GLVDLDGQVGDEVLSPGRAVVQDDAVIDAAYRVPSPEGVAGGRAPGRLGEQVGDAVEVTSVETLGVGVDQGRYRGPVVGHQGRAPRCSSSATASGGWGRANQYPWAASQPRSSRAEACSADSTPSATAVSSRAWAMATTAATMALPSGSSAVRPSTKLLSILSTSIGKRRR